MTDRDQYGYTEEEYRRLGEEAYAQRDDPDAWEDEEPPIIDPEVRSVVSVRFKPEEFGPVARAADEAGVPVSTYIRNAALTAATAVDLPAVARSVEAIRAELDRLARTLGSTPRRKRTNGKRSAA